MSNFARVIKKTPQHAINLHSVVAHRNPQSIKLRVFDVLSWEYLLSMRWKEQNYSYDLFEPWRMMPLKSFASVNP